MTYELQRPLEVFYTIIKEQAKLTFTQVLSHLSLTKYADNIAIREGFRKAKRFKFNNFILESDF